MKLDQFEGKWEQLKGQARVQWGKLTNDDLAVVHGKKEQLIGKLRERYGYSEDEAERELGIFMKSCGKTTGKTKSKSM